jgi:hypothetical protein
MHTLHNRPESILIFGKAKISLLEVFQMAAKNRSYRIVTRQGKRRIFTCSNYQPYFWSNDQGKELHTGEWKFYDVLEYHGLRFNYYPILTLVNVSFDVEPISDNEEKGG